MGNVVEFELKSGKTVDLSRQAASIASLSLAVAEHMQTTSSAKRPMQETGSEVVLHEEWLDRSMNVSG